MSLLGDDGNGMTIMGCTFGNEAIQINYTDMRQTSKRGGVESALTISRKGIDGLVRDIEEALVEIIDEYFRDLRDVPDTLPGGPRLHRKHAGEEDEGDE